MRIKKLIDEDFVNYKLPSMFIGTISCNGKCCIEANIPMSVCQNDEWRKSATIVSDDDMLISRYTRNPITKAIVFGGLEPFEQFYEMYRLILKLRKEYKCNDDVVIYTGYNESEVLSQVEKLRELGNIVIKFGRYVPGQMGHYDEILGVYLASENQYARRL